VGKKSDFGEKKQGRLGKDEKKKATAINYLQWL
jgi:hypothetical protein